MVTHLENFQVLHNVSHDRRYWYVNGEMLRIPTHVKCVSAWMNDPTGDWWVEWYARGHLERMVFPGEMNVASVARAVAAVWRMEAS